MATIYDVAKQAGVSTATVSRSFAKSNALKHQTRQRVLEVAERLNYRPRGSNPNPVNSVARIRSTSASVAIGFQFFAYTAADTLPNNPFYGPILASAQAEADALGMHFLMHTTYRHKLTRDLPQMIREQAVAGMLLVGTAEPEILQSFLQFVPHIVLVDNRDATMQHDCIVSDGHSGAFAATQHLLRLGHRRIGFLTTKMPEVTLNDRLNGYVAAHFHAGVPVNKSTILEVNVSENASEHFVSIDEVVAFLQRQDRPTAFVAANDIHALSLLKACRTLDISVPDEMSVVGYDDIDMSAHVSPPLTTVRVDKAQLGRLAVRRLHMRLQEPKNGMEPEPPVLIELPVSLIERESCAPYRSS